MLFSQEEHGRAANYNTIPTHAQHIRISIDKHTYTHTAVHTFIYNEDQITLNRFHTLLAFGDVQRGI